jgi:hypothetical protein
MVGWLSSNRRHESAEARLKRIDLFCRVRNDCRGEVHSGRGDFVVPRSAIHRAVCLLTASTVIVHGAVGCCAHHEHHQVAHSHVATCGDGEADSRAACSCRGHASDDRKAVFTSTSSSDEQQPTTPKHAVCQGDRCVTLLTDHVTIPDIPLVGWALPPLEVGAVTSAGLADDVPSIPHLRAHLLVHVLLI